MRAYIMLYTFWHVKKLNYSCNVQCFLFQWSVFKFKIIIVKIYRRLPFLLEFNMKKMDIYFSLAAVKQFVFMILDQVIRQFNLTYMSYLWITQTKEEFFDVSYKSILSITNTILSKNIFILINFARTFIIFSCFINSRWLEWVNRSLKQHCLLIGYQVTKKKYPYLKKEIYLVLVAWKLRTLKAT